MVKGTKDNAKGLNLDSADPLIPEPPAHESVHSLEEPITVNDDLTTDEESLAFDYDDEPLISWQPNYQTKILHIFQASLPWLIMLLLDILGTSFPNSKLYKTWINLDPSGTSGYIDLGGSLFAMLFIVVGYLTLCANLKLFIDYWTERQPRTHWDRNHSNTQQLLTRFFLVVFFVPLVPGVFLYPCFAIKIHISVEPEPPTCKDQGFPSSIVMQVINSDQALLYPSISNNVTVTSGHSTFGLKLLPTIVPLGRDIDFQLATSRSLTTSNLFLMLRSEFVFIQLVEKKYEFGYTESGLETNKGNFSDDSFSDLAFPSLGIPLHSTPEMRGSRSSDKRPYVELVDEASLGGAVLKTLEYLPKNIPCTELRMCGAWTMGEMLEDPKKMEAMLVPLGRIMIEMAKYGLARC